MKKFMKYTLWSLAILFFILLVVAILFFVRFRNATKAMTPGETAAINDSVWCVKDNFVNAFIFRGSGGYVMIDAGMNPKNFSKELAKTGINPDSIGTILLTHTDTDHIGAIPLFKNAKIYMHKDEEQMINGTTGKMKFIKFHWKFGPYELLSDTDSLNFGGMDVKMIHTPGHTAGSVCFVVGGDYLVSGDNLILSNGKYEHFVEAFNMDTEVQKEALKAIPDISMFKYILTAHNGVIEVAAGEEN